MGGPPALSKNTGAEGVRSHLSSCGHRRNRKPRVSSRPQLPRAGSEGTATATALPRPACAGRAQGGHPAGTGTPCVRQENRKIPDAEVFLQNSNVEVRNSKQQGPAAAGNLIDISILCDLGVIKLAETLLVRSRFCFLDYWPRASLAFMKLCEATSYWRWPNCLFSTPFSCGHLHLLSSSCILSPPMFRTTILYWNMEGTNSKIEHGNPHQFQYLHNVP